MSGSLRYLKVLQARRISKALVCLKALAYLKAPVLRRMGPD